MEKFDYNDKLLTHHYEMRNRVNVDFVKVVDIENGSVELLCDSVVEMHI